MAVNTSVMFLIFIMIAFFRHVTVSKVAAFKVSHVRGEYLYVFNRGGGSSNLVGLICPLVGIGLTELPWATHYSPITNRYVNFRFKLRSKK